MSPDFQDDDRIPFYVLAFGALAAGLVLLATLHGPGLDPDSVSYLTSGINLAHSNGLTNLTGETLTVFPPGVPAVVALGEWMGVSAQQTTRWLGAACAASIVVLGHLLLRRVGLRRTVLAGATALLAVSPMLLSVSTMASSECPFIVVTLAFLLLLERVWKRGRLGGWDTAALVGLSWAAFMLRYAGGSLVVAGVLTLLLALRPLTTRRSLQVLGFGVLAVAVPTAWLVRNHVSDGTWLGPRVPSPDTPFDVSERILGTTGRWVLGGGAPGVLVVLVGLGSTILVAVLVWARLRGTRHDLGRRRSMLAGVVPPVLFSTVYVVYIACAQLSTGIDPIDLRLLAPVYVPAVLVAALALEEGLARADRSESPRAVREIAGAAILLLAVQAVFTVQAVDGGARFGIGFNAIEIQESEVANRADVLSETRPVHMYSNSVEDLWVATGRQPLYRAPMFAGIRGFPLEGGREQFAQVVACSEIPVLLVMYDEGDPKTFSRAQIEEVVALEMVVDAGDGTVFRAVPLDNDGGDCRTSGHGE